MKIPAREVTDPPVASLLFSSTKASWFWLIVRVYVASFWLQAGWEKVNDSLWTGEQSGAALRGFVQGALAKASGAHPDVQSWYAAFLRDVVAPNAAAWAPWPGANCSSASPCCSEPSPVLPRSSAAS